MKNDKRFVPLKRALRLAELNAKKGGGPFGAVITKGGKVIAEGVNNVTRKNDPTSHAEIEAIRKAAKKLKTFNLKGCVMYASCEPCPMCLAAIYWSGISAVYYGAAKEAAARAGFKDVFIYKELSRLPAKRKLKSSEIKLKEASLPFKEWRSSLKKIKY